MNAATDDKHIRSLIDRIDLFGFCAPVAIPADLSELSPLPGSA
jgi:hypothetical protein